MSFPIQGTKLVVGRSGFHMAGHTKVTMLLCVLKKAGFGASGGGEGIYSTVIEKGRLLCKYKGHMGWGLAIEKRRCF